MTDIKPQEKSAGLLNVESEVASLLHKHRIGVDLHCHFEGILRFSDLQEVAAALDSGGRLLRPETWDFIAQTMADDTISLQNFSKRLTARWMRLLCVAALEEQGTPVEKSMKAFIRKALEVMYAQGLSALELMVSVNTLSTSGDFSVIPLPAQHSAEEEQLIAKWNTELRAGNALTRERLLSLFNEVIVDDPRYARAGSVATSGQMEVGLKYMIRREKDHQIKNDSPTLAEEAAGIEDFRNKGLIVGVDIAGDEYDPSGKVSNFSSFLGMLTDKKIPFTIHAGEVAKASPMAAQSYQNLQDAVTLGARRIGHAVRLFDENEAMQKLAAQVVDQGIYIELNVTSNIWTGATASFRLEEHPIIRALNGTHPLFGQPALLAKLRDTVLVCDDDPVVVSQTTPSLIQELAAAAYLTNNMGEVSLLAMLQRQHERAAHALLWK
jgi:hypothetical protein